MRSRDGVVDIAEWRIAQRAARALEGLLHEPPWLLGVRVVTSQSVGFEIVVTLVRDERDIRMCLPSSIDDVPVRVVARNPSRAPASVSAPSVPSES